jgi:hypothetical protein
MVMREEVVGLAVLRVGGYFEAYRGWGNVEE